MAERAAVNGWSRKGGGGVSLLVKFSLSYAAATVQQLLVISLSSGSLCQSSQYIHRERDKVQLSSQQKTNVVNEVRIQLSLAKYTPSLIAYFHMKDYSNFCCTHSFIQDQITSRCRQLLFDWNPFF